MRREIEQIMGTEKVVNEGLKIALREKSAARGIELFIEYLGVNSFCERVYVFEGRRDTPVSNTFEWCAQGISSEKDFLQNVPFEAVKWWYDAFASQNCLIIENLEAIRETEPLTYDYLKPQNIHSLIAAPLILGDEIIGFFGADNPPDKLVKHITDMAQMVAHFIVSLLEKQRLMNRLEVLSFEDSLSGVRNRHALNEYLDQYRKMENVGIIYCDVLGLKRVNDTLGHQAGDNLIVKASDCLKKSFRRDDIYRVGGDEFLVLCNGIDEEVFWGRENTLRDVMDENGVKMSLGVIWKEAVDNADEAIAEADELMYEAKRAYYAKGGVGR